MGLLLTVQSYVVLSLLSPFSEGSAQMRDQNSLVNDR
jgi:hypothetical protein